MVAGLGFLRNLPRVRHVETERTSDGTCAPADPVGLSRGVWLEVTQSSSR